MLPAYLEKRAYSWMNPPTFAVDSPALGNDDMETLACYESSFMHRQAIAAALRIGLALGTTTPEQVDQAVSARGDTAAVMLANGAMEQVGEWMIGVARSTGVSAEGMRYMQPLYAKITAASEGDTLGFQLVQEAQCWIELGAVLREVPDEITALAYDAVATLSDLSFGVHLDQLLGLEVMTSMLIDEAEQLKAEGLLGDPERALERIMTGAEFEIAQYRLEDSGNDADAVDELLEEMRELVDGRQAPWRDHCNKSRDSLALAESIIRRAWNWRRTNSDLYNSKWTRWALGIALDVRRAIHRKHAAPDYDEIERLLDCTGGALSEGAMFSFGESWAPSFAERMYLARMEAGESLNMAWPLDPESPEKILEPLRYFARAAGWVMLAVEFGAELQC